jgi:UDP-N-acetyl-D-mannosaminuronic acid dehydrogenase
MKLKSEKVNCVMSFDFSFPSPIQVDSSEICESEDIKLKTTIQDFAKENNLLNAIHDRTLRLVVFGCGYVGLATAGLFASKKFKVISIDIQPSIVRNLNAGISPVKEAFLQKLISVNVKAGRLKAKIDPQESLMQSDVVIICVQTPITKDNRPDLSILAGVLNTIGKNLKKGMLVIIRSTIPPNTLRGQIKPKLESFSGLKADEDFYLATVPERLLPGNIDECVGHVLVGGIGPKSNKVTSELFKVINSNVIETSDVTAEICKTAENAYRDVNIAFANQLALICEQQGADVKKVIELANSHPRVKILAPGTGVGGPCLTKDSYLLIHGSNISLNLLDKARDINNYMPYHIVQLAKSAIKKAKKDFEETCITILGTAYKGNVSDSRFSPSEPIIRQLKNFGCQVISFDPFCSESFGAKKAISIWDAIHDSDCIVLAVEHATFKNLNLNKIKCQMKDKPIIIDAKRLIDPYLAKKMGFMYFGIGFGEQNIQASNILIS